GCALSQRTPRVGFPGPDQDRTKTAPRVCAFAEHTLGAVPRGVRVRSPVGCGRWVPQPCNRILTAGAFSGICEPISAGERWHWGCYSCRTSPLSSKENLGLDAASSRVCPFFHPDGARPGDFGGCAGRLPGRLVLRAERLAAGFALIGAAPRAAATRPVAAATRHAAAATRRATPGWSVGRSAGLWPSILSIAATTWGFRASTRRTPAQEKAPPRLPRMGVQSAPGGRAACGRAERGRCGDGRLGLRLPLSRAAVARVRSGRRFSTWR